MNSADALQGYALLGCVHNVLPKAVMLWLEALQSGKQPGELPTPEEPAEHMFADETFDVAAMAVAPGTDEVVADPSTQPWVQWNKTQRSKAKSFATSNPVAMLVLCTAIIEIAVHVLHVCERVGSENFELEQEWQKLQGNPGKLRVLELVDDKLANHVTKMAEELFDSPGKFAALPQSSRTWKWQGVAFVLLSTLLAAMEHYLWAPLRSFPFILFKLLDAEEDKAKVASSILRLPECLRDPWSARVMKIFPTRESLCSQRCLIILYTVALTLRFDIIGLECKHASVRRLTRNRSSTHLADVTDISAEFLLQASRVAGGGVVGPQHPERMSASRHVKKRVIHRKRGGGGVQRVCVGDVLRERPDLDTKSAFKLAHERLSVARRSGGRAWQELVQRGRRATTLHSHGVRRPRRRPACNPLLGPLKKAKQVLLRPGLQQPGQCGVPSGSMRPPEANLLHNETIHSAARLTEGRIADYREQVKEEREKIGKANDDLQSFSDKHALANSCRLLPGVPRNTRPQGGLESDLSIQVEKFVAPVASYVESVLLSSRADIQQELLGAWSLKHVPFRHKDAESGKSHAHRPLTDVTLCMRAGFCCCGDAARRQMAAAVQTYVGKLSAKNAPTRPLMDSRRAVLLLEHECEKYFFHIAYVNKKHQHYIFLPLQLLDEKEDWLCPPARTQLLTRPAHDLRFHNLVDNLLGPKHEHRHGRSKVLGQAGLL